MSNTQYFINEQDYPDLDIQALAERLAGGLRFRTTSYVDTSKMDFTQFNAMQDYMRNQYPEIARQGDWELIGHSLLIKIPGSNLTLKPALFIAHQDVVPVVKGTEADWLHDPFSGDIADGYIWGRGAMDIKEMLFAILEAAEYLLTHGKTFTRTVYMAFGEDEETLNTGAERIGKLLEARGITLEYVWDEGGGRVESGEAYGAPDVNTCAICIYEKGYADLKLSVESQGGHSANPYYGTSLGVLAQAISTVLEHPLKSKLTPCVKRSLELMKPYISQEPMRSLVQNISDNEEAILAYFKKQKSLYNQVQTTIAPTMISEGSQAGNVMPQHMEAVINFRLAEQDTAASLLEYVRSLVGSRIALEYVQYIDASIPSEIDSYSYKELEQTLKHYFKDLIFLPEVSRNTTDAHNYERVCRCCYRFGPFLEEEDIQTAGIHGTNERISVRAYAQGVRTILHMMEKTCVMKGTVN